MSDKSYAEGKLKAARQHRAELAKEMGSWLAAGGRPDTVTWGELLREVAKLVEDRDRLSQDMAELKDPEMPHKALAAALGKDPEAYDFDELLAEVSHMRTAYFEALEDVAKLEASTGERRQSVADPRPGLALALEMVEAMQRGALTREHPSLDDALRGVMVIALKNIASALRETLRTLSAPQPEATPSTRPAGD